ncbi:hypothetical protein M3656_17700 [Sphingomonas paucimobilis]|nr:hypothetical protein [Sphingomonas paucimobilis]
MLAVGVGLSHAGTVRLADRLTAEGLIESRATATDGRVRSLHRKRGLRAALPVWP